MIATAAILIGAALLEILGDAMTRLGLERRNWWIVAGAITLATYGLLVNQTRLDFGRLMGVYITVFFAVSQIVAWVMFRQVPDGRIAMGGGLVILGGILMMRP
ncbi:MAG: hypothetical protein ABSD31_02440 [Candidatus Binataceae bacterium]|jgi:small multidrug resistance family-3 protein